MEELTEQVSREVVGALAKLRAKQGLTLQALADQTDLDRSYIGLLEKGKRRPTLEVVLRLSWALGTTLSALLAKLEKRIKTR